jgi:hypothetical protein
MTSQLYLGTSYPLLGANFDMPEMRLDLRKRSEHASCMVDVVACSFANCGEVDVPIGAILLSETDENEGGYGFRCPSAETESGRKTRTALRSRSWHSSASRTSKPSPWLPDRAVLERSAQCLQRSADNAPCAYTEQ